MRLTQDWQLRNMGIALLGIWLGIVGYALLTGLSGMLTVHHYHFRAWEQIRFTTLFVWLPWVLLVPLVHVLATRMPVLPDNWVRALLRHIGCMFLLALLHGFMSAQLYFRIGYMTEDMQSYAAWQHTGHFLFIDGMFLIDAFIYSLLVASHNISRFYRLAQRKELDALRMEGQVSEARLQALRMQVNPHFLFNTLNAIVVLVRRGDHATAEAMLTNLGDFFRMTLARGEQHWLPLRQELALVEQYLAIEKVRFGERLQVEYQVADDCLDASVPVLLLQPLVENAIKHGLARKPGPCVLRISVWRDAEGLQLQVADDGAGCANLQPVAGVGLRNVQERLAALYPDRHRFVFDSSPGAGTTVAIALGWQAAGGLA